MRRTQNQLFRLGIQRLAASFLVMIFIFSGLRAPAEPARDATAPKIETQPRRAIQIVFFTPADRAVPSGTRERLTQIAEATEKFFFDEMNHWGYPPAVKGLFQREPDGLVEVLYVKGDLKTSSGKYDKPDYAKEVIKQATRQYHVSGDGLVWWIFVYLGEPPVRFGDFRGIGDARGGGWAMVNYDSTSGEIRSDLGLAEGFNGKYFLKGTIHELGHALGLPHTGPDLSLGLGNSLMGPTTAAYRARHGPNSEQVYLNQSSAAMLWKHPLFSGISMGDADSSGAKLEEYQPVFDPAKDVMTISGKLVSKEPAHSVVLFDDCGKPADQYWNQSHVARIGPDGAFQITIHGPAKTSGCYRMLFCFDDGLVSGDGYHGTFENRGEIKKAYSFQNGEYEFSESTKNAR